MKIDRGFVLRLRCGHAEKSKLQMEPNGRNEHRSAGAIVSRMVDVLRVKRCKNAPPNVRSVIGFQDVLTGITQVSVSEQELLEFAATHILERAAVPKRVRIAQRLPLTGVGKIFKPALQQQEIESVVRSEAETAGVTITSMALDRNPQLGVVVRIQAHQGAKLQAALDRYAFRSEVLE